VRWRYDAPRSGSSNPLWINRRHGYLLLMFALATAHRLQYAQTDAGSAPVGWQRGRRQLTGQIRDHVIVFAQGCYGLFHLVEYLLLVGSTSKIALLGSVQGRKFWPNIGSQHMPKLISESQDANKYYC
jgi:hypothetical protein